MSSLLLWIVALVGILATCESRSPLPRAHIPLQMVQISGLFGSKVPFSHMPESRATRTEILETITSLRSENHELRAQVTAFASNHSKTNNYLRSIEGFLVEEQCRHRNVLAWLAAVFRWIFNGKQRPRHELLEEIGNASCTILQLELEVTMLQDVLAQRDLSIDSLEQQLAASIKAQEKFQRALQNGKERKEENRAISRLQDQVEKAQKEIDRLVTQKDSLADSKAKERISFQLRIEQKQNIIDTLEEELDRKRNRVRDLEAEVFGATNRLDTLATRDNEYRELQIENSRITNERLQLQTKIVGLEAALNGAKEEAEGRLRHQRQRLQSKIDALREEQDRLGNLNLELSGKLSILEMKNKDTQDSANKEDSQRREEVTEKVRNELEERLKGEHGRLLASIESLEGNQLRLRQENDKLTKELSISQSKKSETDNQHEATVAELQQWKERAAQLESRTTEASDIAKAASDENAVLRQQLNSVIQERVILRQQLASTSKAEDKNQMMHTLADKWKTNQDENRAKLEEVAKAQKSSKPTPFTRPAFGLGRNNEGD